MIVQLTCPECAGAVEHPFTRCPYCGFELAFKLEDFRVDGDQYPREYRDTHEVMYINVIRIYLSMSMPRNKNVPSEHIARLILPFHNGERVVKDLDTGKYVRDTPRIRAGVDPMYINRTDIHIYYPEPFKTCISASYTALASIHPDQEEMVAHLARTRPLEVHEHQIEIRQYKLVDPAFMIEHARREFERVF